MKNCPYCGQQNPEENQFCNKCGADMVNQTQTPVSVIQASPLTKGYVKFALYVLAVLCPIIGLPLGFLVSLSPFANQQNISSGVIKVSAAFMIVWPCIAFWVAFLVGLISAL